MGELQGRSRLTLTNTAQSATCRKNSSSSVSAPALALGRRTLADGLLANGLHASETCWQWGAPSAARGLNSPSILLRAKGIPNAKQEDGRHNSRT
jgi:hypothetical protein